MNKTVLLYGINNLKICLLSVTLSKSKLMAVGHPRSNVFKLYPLQLK